MGKGRYGILPVELLASPAWAAAGAEGRSLYVCGIMWSYAYSTFGAIPPHCLPMMMGDEETAGRLVEVGLWERVANPSNATFATFASLANEFCYKFARWGEWQTTQELLLDRQAKRAAAGRMGGLAKAAKHQVSEPILANSSKPLANASPMLKHVLANSSNTEHKQNISRTKEPPLPPLGGGETPKNRNPQPQKPTPKTNPEKTPEGFNEFWEQYPRKIAKAPAKAAYIKALNKTNPKTIISGAKNYSESPTRSTDPRLTAHPATWLNGERWDDEPEASPPQKPPAAASRAEINIQRGLAALAKINAQNATQQPEPLRLITGTNNE